MQKGLENSKPKLIEKNYNFINLNITGILSIKFEPDE